jgi:hypothetical protein
MARRRKPSTAAQPSREITHHAEARGVAAGTGRAQGDGRQGIVVFDATNEAAALAARGHRAIQAKKAEQDAFVRERAFHYFDQLPLDKMTNQHAAGFLLDWIAGEIFREPKSRRRLNQIRRRLGGLRKEFLRLRAKGQIRRK